MHSASHTIRGRGPLPFALVLSGLLLVGGCDSTYQENTRAKLAAERRLVTTTPTFVTQRTPLVRVERVTLLRGGGPDAVVVEVRNASDQTVTDLPVSVGVIRGSKRVWLNRQAELPYFQTHLTSVPAKGRSTWVFQRTTGPTARSGDIPFVRIGAPRRQPTSPTPPTITTSIERLDARAATVVLDKASIPQRDMPVALVVRRGKQPVAAGVAFIPFLDRNERVDVTVRLAGRSAGGTPTAFALPTILS